MAKTNKPVNFKAKYITLGIMVAVLIAVVVLFFVLNSRGQDAKAVMAMETNPGVQVVLNANNKVVGQVALNADGEKMLAVVSFKGLTAEQAAELFAKTSTEMEKMNSYNGSAFVSGKAGKVTITISAENSANYANLASKVKNTVNKYFSENGVMAGAVTELSNDISSAVNKMIIDTRETAHMTTQEILNYTKQSCAELEKMAIDTRAEVKAKYNEIYDAVLKMTDAAFDAADDIFATAEQEWKNIEKQYNEASKEIKKTLQAGYDAAKKTYNEAKDAYNKAKADYNKTKVEFKKQLDAAIEKIEKAAQDAFEQMKTEAKNIYNTTKKLIDTNISKFKELSKKQQDALKQSIKEFQDRLAKPITQ